MTDKETASAEELRNEKLMAARRKLKRFQNRKTDQVDEGDSNKVLYEESRDGVNELVASGQDSPPSKCSVGFDENAVQSSQPSPAHAAALTATQNSQISSSLPPPSLEESATSISGISANGPHYDSIQQQIEGLQDRKPFTVSPFNEQHSQAQSTNEQQRCEATEKYRLLEQDYDQVRRQFLESTATCQSQSAKLIDLQASLEAAQQQITELTASPSCADTEESKDSNQPRKIEKAHTPNTSQRQYDTTKQLLEDNTIIVNDLKEQMNHLEQERNVLQQQLHASQQSVSMKDEELETAAVDLGHLEQQYTSIKQTLNEKESLYADLLKTKGDIEQQLQHTTEQNQSIHIQQRQFITGRLHQVNQKVDHVSAAYEKVEQKAIDVEIKVAEQDQHWQHKQNEWDSKKVRYDEIEAQFNQQHLYIRSLEVNQQSLEQQVETLQRDLDEMRNLASEAEKARSNLQEQHTTKQSQLESSLTNLETQQALVTTLNAQLQSRTDQVDELNAKTKVMEKEKDDILVEWKRRYQDLELKLKDQTLKQHALEEEKDQQDASLKTIKSTIEQLQLTVSDLEQQLVSERAMIATANIKIKQQADELEHMAQNDLLQQERDKRQEEVGSLSSQMASLQRQLVELQDEAQQHTQRYNEKVGALALSTQKHDDVERLLEQTRYWWMAEQTKVANMTEDVTQLRRQLEHNMNDRQKLQRQLDETKQLLANRDQNTEALQWQVTDMESNTQHQLDLLSQQLKGAHEELVIKSKQVEQLQVQLSAITSAATRATATIDQQNTAMASLSPLTKPLPQSPTAPNDNNTEPEPSEREIQMESAMRELHQRLERQYEAFSTIRDELTTVRARQLDVELNASKEKDHLVREQKELELTIGKLRTEYQDHLQRIWEQHQATRHYHEEGLNLGRNALDAAQVKLMQNGLSPVSENGFDWMNAEDDGYEHDNHHNHNTRNGVDTNTPLPNTAPTTESTTEPTTLPPTQPTQPTTQPTTQHTMLGFLNTSKSPSLGILPPLEKPAFSEFLETPRCSGCQTEVIDI